MPEPSPFAKSLRNPWQWLGIALILCLFAGIFMGPATKDMSPRQNAIVMQGRAIAVAMYAFASDHGGKFPTGTSSTDVFQKLIDGGYVTDPTIFYRSELRIPGKLQASSNKLKPENVCWDVTIPPDLANSDANLPLVFTTGYRIEYAPEGKATSLIKSPIDGICVSTCGMFAWFRGSDSGVVPNILPAWFNAKGVKYTQLTPDGPLP